MSKSMKQSQFERLERAQGYIGKSYNAIARELELKTPQVFYDIKAGKSSVSYELARVLQEKFLISATWLLTGEGEMLSSEHPVQYDIDTAQELMKRGVELIPMYSEPFRAGNEGATFSASDAQVESYWAIPGIKAQQVISVTGDSMEPTILRGASVAIAPMHFQADEPFAIPFGEVFAIVLHDPDAPSDTVTSYVKRLYRHPSADKQQTHWMAHSDNPRYEDFEICIANITSLWRVLAGVHYYA